MAAALDAAGREAPNADPEAPAYSTPSETLAGWGTKANRRWGRGGTDLAARMQWRTVSARNLLSGI